MANSYSLRGSGGVIAYDNGNNPVGVMQADGSVLRFGPKVYGSTAGVSVTSVASTFSTVTSWDSNSGNVRLNGTGAHGLTAAAIITTNNTGVYVTWTGGIGVNGIYPVTALDVDTSGTKITINYPYLSGTVTVTATDPAVITYTNHGRAVNDTVRFTTTNTLPAGLSTGTTYYVKTVLSANTFTVSASSGGTAIACTDTGTGTHTCVVWYGTAAVTAATASITLVSFTVDGNVLTASGNMEANALFGVTSSANAKRLTITYGGTALLDTGAGSNANFASVNVNKIAWARGSGTIVTSAPTATGHGTNTSGVQALSIAYNTDLTFAITTTMAVANEVTTLAVYQVALS